LLLINSLNVKGRWWWGGGSWHNAEDGA